jgi:hypothetical protein
MHNVTKLYIITTGDRKYKLYLNCNDKWDYRKVCAICAITLKSFKLEMLN